MAGLRKLLINGYEVEITEVNKESKTIRFLGGSVDPLRGGLNFITGARDEWQFWKEGRKLKPFGKPYKDSHAILVAIDDYERRNDPQRRETGFE